MHGNNCTKFWIRGRKLYWLCRVTWMEVAESLATHIYMLEEYSWAYMACSLAVKDPWFGWHPGRRHDWCLRV
jgi:hypothetical protein